MGSRPYLLGVLALLCLWSPSARADEVFLKDGRSFEGRIEKESKSEVVIQTRFGRMSFQACEVERITRGKTTTETFEERYQAARSADDYHALGEWCVEQKLKSEAKRCMKRAIEVDPDHEGARTWLGYVRYEGEWLTPEERDARVRAKEEAEMAAKGFVRQGDGWISREDKQRLERGLVLVDGRWLEPDEANRARGLELWHEQWLPRPLALSQQDADRAEAQAGLPLARAAGASCLLAGTYPTTFLEPIAKGIDGIHDWFLPLYGLDSSNTFLGDRVPQYYLWSRDSQPYVATCTWFAGLTKTVGAGWAEAVSRIHGFVWWDPYCLSSARVWNRPDEDLAGHCYHHAGHLLLNRVLYDGRLLPPWYDEGFAAWVEHRTHQRNAVFCVASAAPVRVSGGTSSKTMELQFESKDFRRGDWRKKLRAALEAGAVPSFDKLAQIEFGGLDLIDVAASMAIVEWLSQREGALPAFHAVLREVAPPAPARVIHEGNPRQQAYDRAFQAAVELPWRGADQAWREWFRRTN